MWKKCHCDNKPIKRAGLSPQFLLRVTCGCCRGNKSVVVTLPESLILILLCVCLIIHLIVLFPVSCLGQLYIYYYFFSRISPACLQTVINQRCPTACDHWTGEFSHKPLLLLLPVVCNLTSVHVTGVRAHAGMHTPFNSRISEITLVQTGL